MSRRREVILPLLLAALGGISMFAGGCRGEMKIMFAKAVNICLESVGIG